MEKQSAYWICICDLFAGLMAFFVFSSSGLIKSYQYALSESMEEHAHYVESHPAPADRPGFADVALPPSGRITVDTSGAIRIGHHFFDNDSYALKTSGGKGAELRSVLKSAAEIIKRAQLQEVIAIQGHASCRCVTSSRDKDGKSKDEDVFCYNYNMNMSLDRARALKDFIYQNDIFDFELYRRTVIIGASEISAGSTQEQAFCDERTLPNDNESPFRLVTISRLPRAQMIRPPK